MPFSSPEAGEVIFRIMQAFITLSFVITAAWIIYMLLTPERRRVLARYLARILPLLMVCVLALLLLRPPPPLEQTPTPTAGEALETSSELSENLPSMPEAEAESPEWRDWTTSLTIATFITAVVLVVWLIVRRQPAKKSTLDQFAREAQDALNRLQAGDDLHNTILRCYREMSRAVLVQRRIRRELSVTPREFEAILVKNGLPAEAVHNLSQLFEMVRYGELPVSKGQEQLARICLQDIIEACKKPEEIHEA